MFKLKGGSHFITKVPYDNIHGLKTYTFEVDSCSKFMKEYDDYVKDGMTGFGFFIQKYGDKLIMGIIEDDYKAINLKSNSGTYMKSAFSIYKEGSGYGPLPPRKGGYRNKSRRSSKTRRSRKNRTKSCRKYHK